PRHRVHHGHQGLRALRARGESTARRRRRAVFIAFGTLIAEHVRGGTAVNWFNLAALGWVILIAALAIAAYKVHVPTIWIAIGALALLGIGIISAVTRAKPRI